MTFALPHVEIILTEAQITSRRFDLEVFVEQQSQSRAQRKRPGRGRDFRQVARQDLPVVRPLDFILRTKLREDKERLPVGRRKNLLTSVDMSRTP